MHLATSAERAEEATTCLLKEWQRLLETPLQPEETQLALAKFRGQEAMGRQTCGQIADRTALLLSHGLSPHHLEEILLRAEALDGEAMLAAARRWLATPSLSLVGPREAVAAAERAWQRHRLSGAARSGRA
jgi:predicted Zn-dependent peptidase